MARLTYILLGAVSPLTGLSKATCERWANRGYFGPLKASPGCSERKRLVAVSAIEQLLGRKFRPADVRRAIAKHEETKAQRRGLRSPSGMSPAVAELLALETKGQCND
jgi:hypothetical protein